MIRASYEFLAGPEGKPVAASQVYLFLQQSETQLGHQLSTYQPVFPWLIQGRLFAAEFAEDECYAFSLSDAVRREACRCLAECISFPSQEAQLVEAAKQREAVEAANQCHQQQVEQQSEALARAQRQHEELQQKQERIIQRAGAVLLSLLLFGSGIVVGYFLLKGN